MSTSKKLPRPKRTRATSWSWTEIGTRLLEVQEAGTWSETATSFSAYVRNEAMKLGVHQSALWRAMAAVSFYSKLGTHFEGWRLPPLERLESATSPEILELIERHSRVQPRMETLAYLQRAAAGLLTRRELLNSWRLFSEALPLTQRGRPRSSRGIAPGISIIHTVESTSRLIMELSTGSLEWTGMRNPFVRRLFFAPTTVIKAPNGEREWSIDLAIVLQETKVSEAYIHGVQALFDVSASRLEQLAACSRQLDFLWVATTSSHADVIGSGLASTDWIGIIAVDKAVKVHKRALQTPFTQSEFRRFAVSLLATGK